MYPHTLLRTQYQNNCTWTDKESIWQISSENSQQWTPRERVIKQLQNRNPFHISQYMDFLSQRLHLDCLLSVEIRLEKQIIQIGKYLSSPSLPCYLRNSYIAHSFHSHDKKTFNALYHNSMIKQIQLSQAIH